MKRLVVCDFDGTITAQETFVAVLKHFAPEKAAQLIPEMYARRLTLRQGVRQILESIPSRCYPDIVEFTRHQPIRAGFADFLSFLAEQAVPLVVISGGLQGMVEVVVQPFLSQIHGLHAVELDLSGEYLQVRSPDEGETELVDKVKIAQSYKADQVIAIGDSVTDLNVALMADQVFARDRLINYLDEHQTPYQQWHDFFDVRDALIHQWNLTTP